MWIRLQSLALFAYHGAYDEERRTGNRFEVDVELCVPDTLGDRDDLSSTIDYTAIADIVLRISNATIYHLLERFCADLCQAILMFDQSITEVIVRLRKLQPPLRPEAKSVEIERRVVR